MKRKSNYRVTRMVNFDKRLTLKFYVESPEEGARLINALAQVDLQNEEITDNSFFLEVYEDSEWTDWYADDGDNVDNLCDEFSEYVVKGE